MADPILQVAGLRKDFPVYAGVLRHQVGAVQAVRGISFEVGSGKVLGMVGESGSGKSTAARAAIRLIEPTSGTIKYQGEDLLTVDSDKLRTLRRDLQMIFQDPASSLNPRMAVGEAVAEAVRYHAVVPREETHDYVAAIFERVGLSPSQMKRYPHEFSGGQQQRICIGRAIALKPKLLVCDESVSALDVSVQAQILNLLEELKQELGLSYLFISHDLSVVRHISDRVAVMYRGKIVEEGETEEVFAQPRHEYTKTLLSAEPITHPRERARVLIPENSQG